MVKPPTFDSNGMKKGAWSKEEDEILRAYVARFGHSNWRLLPSFAGLARCRKSCRLRWVNYLKPGLKRGKFTKQEEELVIKLHNQIGNKWFTMAAKMPGRTDNEIKNYWHAHIKNRRRRGGDSDYSRRAPKLKEEDQDQDRESSSSETNSCVTIDDHQEESGENPKKIDAPINPIADLYSFARAQHDDSYNQTFLSQLNLDLPPLAPKEELHDFEMFREMQNDSSNSSFSDGGDLWFESFGEETLDMVLW